MSPDRADRADRRVRRTRASLVDALLALMPEKGYQAITVQDLIDRADVGRSTFYAHFTDKSELLHEALSGLRALLEVGHPVALPDRRRPLRFSREMFHHVQDQRQLLRALLVRPGAGEVMTEIERVLQDVAHAELRALAGAQTAVRVPLDLLARSVVAGYLALLSWWVENDFAQSPDQMDAMFQAIVGPGVRAAIPPPQP